MNLNPISLINVSLNLPETVQKVGRIGLKNRRFYFQYDPAFLNSGIEISPFKLPLKPETTFCDDMIFEGLFGVFNDSLPDGWGRLLLDRLVRSKGIIPEQLTPLDRLAYVGKNGMGALIYEPEIQPQISWPEHIDLDSLAKESSRILEGESDAMLAQLLELSGSSAGARPKIMTGVNHDFSRIIHGQHELPNHFDHWLIKFHSSNDAKDIGPIEYAYSLMAKSAGISMPQTHLFHTPHANRFFGVKRFDRNGLYRFHIHTIAGLLHSDHRVPSLDYEQALRLTLILTKSNEQLETMFRLAVFNVMTHNRDDHAKNFAFIMSPDGKWNLAPAYDLTFSSGPGGEQSTTVLGEGRNPTREHLRKLGEKYQIAKTKSIIEQVTESVNQWSLFAKEAEVSPASTQLIQKTIQSISRY